MPIPFLRSDIYENLKMAIATLRANKLRSFLTVFGVVIGVITVMLIASIISGIDVSVKREVESFGTRSIFISKFNPGIHIGRLSREERMRKELTYDDAIAISGLPTVEISVPFLDITNNFFGGRLTVSGGGKTSAGDGDTPRTGGSTSGSRRCSGAMTGDPERRSPTSS